MAPDTRPRFRSQSRGIVILATSSTPRADGGRDLRAYLAYGLGAVQVAVRRDIAR